MQKHSFVPEVVLQSRKFPALADRAAGPALAALVGGALETLCCEPSHLPAPGCGGGRSPLDLLPQLSPFNTCP